MSRPDALTEENSRLVLEAIRSGASLRVAAAHAGLHHTTVIGWRQIGEKAEEKKTEERTEYENRCLAFSTRLSKSQADAVLTFQALVTKISQSKDESVALRAATWWLERRAKEDYAPRQEVTGAEGGPIELDGSEAYRALKELLDGEA